MQVKGTRMLRVKAVAAMFDVSPSTIYRLIEAGKLDALKMSAGSERGSLRIPEYAVAAFTQACAEAAYSTENARAVQGSAPVGEVR